MSPATGEPLAKPRARTARRLTDRLLAVVLLLAVAGLLLLAWAGAAAAHARLRASEPADGQLLQTPPGAVALEFNEPVEVPAGAVRVFDATGRRVDRGDLAVDGARLRLPLPADASDGTYVVTYRVTSADGHPVHGAFVYDVGAPSGEADAILAAVAAETADTGWSVAATAARFLVYAGALLAAGGILFLLRVHDGADDERPALVRVVVAGAAASGAATVVGFALQGVLVSGLGAAALVDPAVLGATATSSVGTSAAVRLAGCIAVAVGASGLRPTRRLPGRPGRRTAGGRLLSGGGAALIVGSFLLTGHTATSRPRWLVVGADLAHVLAAATWFGGLALLLVVLRHRSADAIGASALVGRFSSLATVAVAVVSAASLALAWMEVRAPTALLSTAYGWTLVVKVAAVAPVVAVGAYNQRRLVPAVQRAGTEGWQLLRRTVRLEVAGLCAVLVVTAVLVNLVPAREAAGITGPYSTTTALGPDHLLDVTVDPHRAGRNQIHLYLLDAGGRPADAERLRLALSLPAKDIGPLQRTPDRVAPGHWSLYGAELPIPGRWTLRVTAQVDEFTEAAAEIPLDVGG